jgi:MFS family permease
MSTPELPRRVESGGRPPSSRPDGVPPTGVPAWDLALAAAPAAAAADPSPGAGARAEPAESSPAAAPADIGVWRNVPFLRLWGAQAITQTAHNALWYALMVVVEQRSHSTTHMGVTILTVVLPSVLFGVVAGALVDHWEKRRVLIVCNVLRAFLMTGFVLVDEWLLALFTLSFIFSTVTQFFAPAETALIPALVHQRRLMQANSLFHITFTASQLAGLVLIGPLLVKMFGVTVFFLLVGASFIVSAILVWPLPVIREASMLSAAEESRRLVRRLRQDLHELLVFLRGDREVGWAMVHLTVGSTLMLVVAMLAPNFVVSVLGIAVEDVVYIMAPAGVGMLLAALALQHVASRVRKGVLIQFGLGAVGVGMLLVGLIPPLWQVLPWTRAVDAVDVPTQLGAVPLPLINASINLVVGLHEPDMRSLITAIMAVTLIAGMGFACIIVPAQTILQERAPVDSRARIFAVQLMLGSVASVLPLLFIGGIADLVGTTWVFLGLGLVVLAFYYLQLRHVRGAPAEDAPVHVLAADAADAEPAAH